MTENRGLSLATMGDAMAFAEMVAPTEFAPKDFRGKPAACLLAIQHGSEIGLSPMQSLQSIAVVNGRPTIYGDAALAVCLASVVCEYVQESVDGEGDRMVATCTAQRRGYPAPITSTFSVADAKAAGLWGKQGPWSQYPKRMLAMRARGFALRNAFADVLRGLVTAEEAQDYQVTGIEVVPARAAPAPSVTVAALPAPAPAATESKAAVARRAIAKATTIDRCEQLRDTVEARRKEGLINDLELTELVSLIHAKVETLLPLDAEVPA
jgi:hypothetical protein